MKEKSHPKLGWLIFNFILILLCVVAVRIVSVIDFKEVFLQ